ncbi:hypothetical protein ATANTOWER_026546 [Ataeniobius toweri]|uniref:Uncharacterized protein n=1 Tax=Ataeniobius toweri TaxID=208326 RepID=A0ABU7A8K4_9TELE|nr:hypothetical protein [Ataeniobius toweri]
MTPKQMNSEPVLNSKLWMCNLQLNTLTSHIPSGERFYGHMKQRWSQRQVVCLEEFQPKNTAQTVKHGCRSIMMRVCLPVLLVKFFNLTSVINGKRVETTMYKRKPNISNPPYQKFKEMWLNL